MFYFICEYCGKHKTSFKKIPKCGCEGGNGKTYMTYVTKKQYKSWKRNIS